MDKENVIDFHFQTLHNHVSVPQMFLCTCVSAGTTGDCCRNRQPLLPRQSGREREEGEERRGRGRGRRKMLRS